MKSMQNRSCEPLRSAPYPVSMASLLTFVSGILATALWRALAADRVAFRIPFALPPLTLLGRLGIVDDARGLVAMKLIFPRAAMGANVTGAVGVGYDESPLAPHSAGCLYSIGTSVMDDGLRYCSSVRALEAGQQKILTS